MKKLLGIVVLGYRIMWDNSTHTRHKRDKTEKEKSERRKVAPAMENDTGSW